ncbi:MAG: hypothetical protein J6A59_10395 [Lachnospiraceae bacterium]|nr:hypothetical protein [Lachnospiraceae bacterium]
MWHNKPVWISRTEIDKNKSFYEKYNISYNKWIYTNEFLIENYKMGFLVFVDKNLDIQLGCMKIKDLGVCIKTKYSDKIEFINYIDNIIDITTNTKFRIDAIYNNMGVNNKSFINIINGPFPYKRVSEDYKDLIVNYSYALDKMINQAIKFKDEIQKQKIVHETCENDYYSSKNSVVVRFGNKGIYGLKFYTAYIELDKFFKNGTEKTIIVKKDSLNDLIDLLDKYLAIYGFRFRDNLELILDDCGLLLRDSDILKLLLLLTDNIDIKRTNSYVTKTIPFKNLKLPIKIDLIKLNTELNKIICGETTVCTLPSKLRRYPFLKDVPYIGDRAKAISDGDSLRVHIYLKSTYFNNKEDLVDAIRRDIKNIIKECFRAINSGYIVVYGEIAPLNMYNVQSYKILNGTELIITLKLKISSYTIEKDALDLLDEQNKQLKPKSNKG